VVDAVFARDYPLVQGVVLLIADGFILKQPARRPPLWLIDPRINIASLRPLSGSRPLRRR